MGGGYFEEARLTFMESNIVEQVKVYIVEVSG